MKRVYRFTPSWWIVGVCLGIFLIFIGISTLIINFPDTVESKINFLDYLGLLTIVLLMILFGILIILMLISSKIVITDAGLEYYSFVSVYYSDWKDLECAGDAIILFSTKAKIKVSAWANRLPWDVEKGTISRGIPVSWFGGLNGRKLRSEIAVHAPNLLRSSPQMPNGW